MGAERWDEQVGSVAEEAGRLLESLRRSAAQAATEPGAHPAEDRDDDASDDAGTGPAADPPHDPFCQWCPLCRGAAVVRSLSPETLSRLADLATLAASVLADLATSRPAGAPPEESPPRRPSPAPSRVIPVSDADDPQEAPRG